MAIELLKWCALLKSGSVKLLNGKQLLIVTFFMFLLADEEQEAELFNTDRTQQEEITSKEMREGKL